MRTGRERTAPIVPATLPASGHAAADVSGAGAPMHRLLLNVSYTDPANFPPTINACRLQALRGWRVHLVGFYRGVHAEFVAGPGIREEYVNQPPGGYPRSPLGKIADLLSLRRTVARVVRDERPAAIVAYDFHALWSCLPHARRTRVLFHVLDMPPRANVGRLDRLIHGKGLARLSRVSAVVMPNDGRLEVARRLWGFTNGFTAGNCAIHDCPPPDPDARTLLAPASAEHVIVRAGGAGPNHLIDETICAMALLPAGWHLALVGCGDATERARVERLSRERGVAERVRSVPYVSYDTLRRLLPAASLGLATYRSGVPDYNLQFIGTASVKLMEYFAAGLPAVASGAQDLRDLSGRTGAMQLLEAETADGIAAAIRAVLGDPARRRAMQQAARAAFERELNFGHQYARVLQFIGDPARGAA